MKKEVLKKIKDKFKQLNEEQQKDVLMFIEFLHYRERRKLLEKIPTGEIEEEIKRRKGA